MNRKLMLSAVAVLVAGGAVWFAAGTADAPAGPVVQVVKSPTCGCCTEWVEHMREEGFRVEVTDTPDVASAKRRWRVPGDLGSCHTARVEGYVIEGHVPASDVRRLLAQRPPDVLGLAVPGMPAGSPGMEVPGRDEPYQVIAFDGSGGRSVFARH